MKPVRDTPLECGCTKISICDQHYRAAGYEHPREFLLDLKETKTGSNVDHTEGK